LAKPGPEGPSSSIFFPRAKARGFYLKILRGAFAPVLPEILAESRLYLLLPELRMDSSPSFLRVRMTL
jgi:hypothetical protein